jgi:phosphoserine aminotransferase
MYEVVDSYKIYRPKVSKKALCRSRINVTWDIPDKELADKCIEEGINNGLYEFKGHRTVGGFRASLFTPIPDEAVYRLADFL